MGQLVISLNSGLCVVHMHGTQLPSIMDKRKGPPLGFLKKLRHMKQWRYTVEIHPHRCKFKEKGMKKTNFYTTDFQKEQWTCDRRGCLGSSHDALLRFHLQCLSDQLLKLSVLHLFLCVMYLIKSKTVKKKEIRKKE